MSIETLIAVSERPVFFIFLPVWSMSPAAQTNVLVRTRIKMAVSHYLSLGRCDSERQRCCLSTVHAHWKPRAKLCYFSFFPPDCRGHEMGMFYNNVQQSTMFCSVNSMWMYCKKRQLFMNESWNIGKILNFPRLFHPLSSPACPLMIKPSKTRIHLQTDTGWFSLFMPVVVCWCVAGVSAAHLIQMGWS